ncbi:MAG: 4Fe-4S dicluster domain-containing protein [bacterium]|nr:4Fe-4S dicluster domain-containing protein [bacterium]
MGLFVTVKLNPEECQDGCKSCLDVCPVGIFRIEGGKVKVVADNEDECTFCELCLERCGQKLVEIIKNY